MDGVRRKRCETCADHVAGPTPCTGVCLNRVWQPTTDASRFVRDRELACYGGWGIDHWRPKPEGFLPGGPGGAAPGAGGGSGNPPRSSTYGSLSGAAVDLDAAFIRLIPIELLGAQAGSAAGSGFGLDPGDPPRFD